MAPRAFGSLAIASTIADLGAALGGLGLSAAVAQRASALRSRVGDDSTSQAMLAGYRLAIPATVLLAAALPIMGVIMTGDEKLKAAWPAVEAIWPTVLVAPLTAVLLGTLAARFAASRATLAQLSAVLVTSSLTVLFVIFRARAAVDIGVARAVGAVVGLVLLAVVVPANWGSFRAALSRRPVGGSIGSFAGAMLLSTIAWRVVSQLDVFVVGLERGSRVAGLYAPASRIAEFAMVITAPLATYVLPAITRARSELGQSEVGQLYHWSSRWSLLLSAPALAVLVASPGATLHVLFGARFGAVVVPERILGIAAAVQVLFGLNGPTLDAHGVPKIAALWSGLGVVMSVVACAALIPPFGTTGAALATLVAIVVLNSLSSWTLAHRFGIRPWDRRLALTALGFGTSVAGSAVVVDALHPPAFWSCALAAGLTTGVTSLASWAATRDRGAI
jgi:O-antigen/teichoic acid export membrane protein